MQHFATVEASVQHADADGDLRIRLLLEAPNGIVCVAMSLVITSA